VKPSDIESLAKALAPVIKSAIEAEVSSVRREVDRLKDSCEEIKKAYELLPEPSTTLKAVEDKVRKMLDERPIPKDGADADMDALKHHLSIMVSELPTPKDGRDVDMVEVEALVAKAVDAIPRPKDGASADMDALREHLSELVAKIPRPADGKSITAEDVAPVLDMQVAKWALEFERRAQDTLQKAIDKMPVPKDGIDGRDGLGFEDLEVEFDGVKTVTFKLVRGDLTKQFDLTMPVVVDCGIFKEGHVYTPGDSVTWAGSYWIAQKDTGAKPDSPESGWRLAVKKGRDGKDGRNSVDKTAPVKL
jgi:exonuclease VII small subunit